MHASRDLRHCTWRAGCVDMDAARQKKPGAPPPVGKLLQAQQVRQVDTDARSTQEVTWKTRTRSKGTAS
jgi:hypothetical protein